jgi:hypothetical protein
MFLRLGYWLKPKPLKKHFDRAGRISQVQSLAEYGFQPNIKLRTGTPLEGWGGKL